MAQNLTSLHMADNLDTLLSHRQNEFIARAKFSLKHENVEGLLNEKELVIFRFSITAREHIVCNI